MSFKRLLIFSLIITDSFIAFISYSHYKDQPSVFIAIIMIIGLIAALSSYIMDSNTKTMNSLTNLTKLHEERFFWVEQREFYGFFISMLKQQKKDSIIYTTSFSTRKPSDSVYPGAMEYLSTLHKMLKKGCFKAIRVFLIDEEGINNGRLDSIIEDICKPLKRCTNVKIVLIVLPSIQSINDFGFIEFQVMYDRAIITCANLSISSGDVPFLCTFSIRLLSFLRSMHNNYICVPNSLVIKEMDTPPIESQQIKESVQALLGNSE